MKVLLDSLGHDSIRQWLIQSLFIIFAALLSIFAVSWVLEKSLVREALEMEAEAFIQAFQQNDQFPLPRTRNLTGFLTNAASDQQQVDGHLPLPTSLRSLMPGLHNVANVLPDERAVPVYVRDFDDKRLYLVFNGANVDRLVGVYGLLPLAFTLALIYGSSWIAYRVSRRAVSPILRIAKNLRETTPENFSVDLSVANLSGEAKELADAIEGYREKSALLVERERQFTADVSHELRTPMTIIDGAAQFLASEKQLSAKGCERVQMIRRASRDVNELITAFLLLSRSQVDAHHVSKTRVSYVVADELNKLKATADLHGIELETCIHKDFETATPRKALEIILGNILRNAAKYTSDGRISITVDNHTLSVEDTGIGIPEELLPHLFERHVRGRGLQQAGEGIGLAIVKRLCDQFDWHITIGNRNNGGVAVELRSTHKLTQ